MWNPDIFTEKFREKAHPEVEFNEKVQEIKDFMLDSHRTSLAHTLQLQDKITNLTKKVEILLDLKSLKEKIDKMI